MAITSTGLNADLYPETQEIKADKDKSILGKDDFLKLLLVELQYQDPTAPMDTEKILTQTSQLATLEASANTTKALEELAASLKTSQNFNTVAAIGKMADLGSNGLIYEKGYSTDFEMYFPSDIASGQVEILDTDGNIIQTIDIEPNEKGVYRFSWDGKNMAGQVEEDGIYYASATYLDSNGTEQKTRMGAYPIESVKFENGKTFLKLGSSYVDLENIKEVY
ncbi:MAG: flagellar hook capping FlgD N-terminal domain-containing protein [Sulfurimonas sp.]|jgi:flagellar basal-body rod modification protein FlgD|nr:flagellar hook capping FlgD N-terminal domain-containing protein [Sulfurimonadaceae bacterium]